MRLGSARPLPRTGFRGNAVAASVRGIACRIVQQPQWQTQQPGGAVPPQQQTPQQQALAQPSARPVPVLVATVFGGAIALALFGLAAYTLIVGWSGASGGGEIVVLLLAFIIAGVGVLYGLGAAALLHSKFPNPAPMKLAATGTALIVAFGATRAARVHTDGPGVAGLVGWVVMGLVVITLLVLLSRPSVKQWVQATQAHSRSLGHVPKRGPR